MSGYVYERNDRKGKWVLVYPMGYDVMGKQLRKRKTITAKNKREAERILHKWATEIEAGDYIDPSDMPFSVFVGRWQENYAKANLAPATYDTYEGILSSLFVPSIGKKKLSKITTYDLVQLFHNISEERQIKPATLQKYKNAISNVFNRAVEWKILKSNPAIGVHASKGIHTSKEAFDEQEMNWILECSKKEDLYWHAAIRLALELGMRRGEIVALEWNQINFVDHTITIQQSLTLNQQRTDRLSLKGTKTDRWRTVDMSDALASLLKELSKEKKKEMAGMEELWQGKKHFFVITDETDETGRPFRPDAISKRWRRFRMKYNIRTLPFHSLRHTSATWLLNHGVSPKVIQERLGHRDIKTTLNVYSHVLKDTRRDVANMFDTFKEEGELK